MFFLLSQRQKNRRIKLLVDKDLASCQDSTPNNSGDKRLESSAVESFNNNDGSNENKFRGNHMSVYGSNSYEEEVNDDIELLHDVSFENVEETDDGEDEKKGFESIDEDVGVNKTAGQNTCCGKFLNGFHLIMGRFNNLYTSNEYEFLCFQIIVKM